MQAWARLDSLKGCFQGRKGTVWILAGILLLALTLRVCPLENLTRGSILAVEVLTMADAASPFSHDITYDQGPLKFYLLHAVLYLGRSEFLLALPALFFDLASILLLFYLGTLLFDRKTALLACFFMAVSVWHIHYASSARNYPLYYFSVLASTAFLYRAIKTSDMRDWIFFAVAAAFGFYSFLPSLFFLIAQICWFFIFYGRRGDLIKRLLISLGLFVALVAPQAGRLSDAFEYNRDFGAATFHIETWSLQGRRLWVALRDHLGGITGLYPLGIFIFVLSFVWIFYFQKKKAQSLLLWMLVMMPICFYIFCNYAFRMSVASRYFLFVYPFFLLTAAAGIASFPYLAGRIAGTFVFLLPLCLYGFFQAGLITRDSIPSDYLFFPESDAAAIASLIEKNQDALDFVVVKPRIDIFGVQYYLDKANRSPLVEANGIFGKNYFMYTGSKILLLGSDGDLPLLKYLAAAGRLLVIDFSRGSEGDDATFPWLRSNASGMGRYRATDFYFLPPPRISGDYKDSSAIARRKLLLESRIVRRLIYPFNRKERTLLEN
ncbi:MAG: glycosyltransferase family 39 protein [Candidatus Omnitrophota bacterium]